MGSGDSRVRDLTTLRRNVAVASCIEAIESSTVPVRRINPSIPRKVPRAGFAAAQDDLIVSYFFMLGSSAGLM